MLFFFSRFIQLCVCVCVCGGVGEGTLLRVSKLEILFSIILFIKLGNRAPDSVLSFAGGRVRGSPTDSVLAVVLVELLVELLEDRLGVSEEHLGVLLEEERVRDVGVAGSHRSLDDDAVLGLPHSEDRHAGDRGVRVLLSGRVDDVVGTADEHDVSVAPVFVADGGRRRGGG